MRPEDGDSASESGPHWECCDYLVTGTLETLRTEYIAAVASRACGYSSMLVKCVGNHKSLQKALEENFSCISLELGCWVTAKHSAAMEKAAVRWISFFSSLERPLLNRKWFSSF